MAQMVQCLSSTYESMDSVLDTIQTGDGGRGRTGVQGYLQLHIEFEAGLSYIKTMS